MAAAKTLARCRVQGVEESARAQQHGSTVSSNKHFGGGEGGRHLRRNILKRRAPHSDGSESSKERSKHSTSCMLLSAWCTWQGKAHAHDTAPLRISRMLFDCQHDAWLLKPPL